MTTTTVISTEENNGRIFSKNANYNTARNGSNLNVSATSSEMGQLRTATPEYFLYETFLAFDTSVIPDDDVIDSVVLRIYGDFDNSAQDFTVEARLYTWGAPTLTSADWADAAELAAATLLATFNTAGGWVSGDFNDFTDVALVANINKTGLTEMIVTSDRLRLGNAPATGTDERVGSFLTLEGQRPRLVIEHHATGADLVIQDASHAHTAESQSLTQVHNLAVDEASHGHAADQQALTQVHNLITADGLHAHSADNLVLEVEGDLGIAGATHGHTADSLALIQDHELVVADAEHGHSADALGLAQVHNLDIAEALQGHTADNVVLIAEGDLAIADAVHAHVADTLGLAQVHELVVQDASHGHLAEALALVIDLGIQDALHGHSADNIILTQLHILLVADAAHAHTADNVVLSAFLPVAGRTGTATPRRTTVGVSRRQTVATPRR